MPRVRHFAIGLALLLVPLPASLVGTALAQHRHDPDFEEPVAGPRPAEEEEESFLDVIRGWFAGEPEEEPTVRERYEEGLARFYDHDFPGATKIFDRILDESPYSTYAILAELKIAEAHYYEGKTEEALPLLDKFAKAHPANPNLPYVTYLVGMCHRRQMDSIDRDQTETEAAVTTFRILIDQFPDSLYTPVAARRLAECRERLAEHEMYVGRFYHKGGDYGAAAGRFQTVLEAYPEAKVRDEALYLLAMSLKKQKKWIEAEAKLEELLDTRPEGEYTARAKADLLVVRREASEAASPAGASGDEGRVTGDEEDEGWFPWF